MRDRKPPPEPFADLGEAMRDVLTPPLLWLLGLLQRIARRT